MTPIVMESPEVYASAGAIAQTELVELHAQLDCWQIGVGEYRVQVDEVLDQALEAAIGIEHRIAQYGFAALNAA